MSSNDLLPDASLSDEPEEIGAEAAQLIESCRLDFNFMAAMAMPMVFKYLWPVFYLSAFLS